jgi:restriction system-associated AAA family ATPase
MKLISLEIGDRFRSLHPGFFMDFNNLTEKGLSEMSKFQPFCFAGLNGTGKSNVLEALASIFYHLELCVAEYRPDSLKKYFKPEVSNPNSFVLKYLMKSLNDNDYEIITIKKVEGNVPKMFRQSYYLDNNQIIINEEFEISLDIMDSQSDMAGAEGKAYLPEIVIGYSSGENEILSIPFLKARLIHFDEYKETVIKNYAYNEPETSLIYIDSEMSQAVLLSILLFENEETLKPLEKELHIKGLRSFRINLNLHKFEYGIEGEKSLPILQQLDPQISKLKNCASSWYSDSGIMWLDFFVDQETKAAFHANFKNSFELFRLFQVLYELNSIIVKDSIKEEVYSSKGYYTNGKLPTGSPEQNVFYFLDYLIIKDNGEEQEPSELLLRNFSDGEHQFLHTLGICFMLKDRSSLLLLDEPETHFNPGWRAKFIKVLSDGIKAGGGNNMIKEILLSSHSPFIISDCMPNNVIYFERNPKSKLIEAKSAKKLGFNTYGTSIEIISEILFKYSQSIGELSNSDLEEIEFKNIKTKEDVINAKKLFTHLGDSIEKDLILARLNQLVPKSEK